MKQLLFFFCFSIGLMISSCGDPCDEVDCGTGTCVEGTCDCPDAYSGTNCEIFDACFGVDCGPGTCTDGTCDCPDGYSGANCETFDPCFDVDCGDGGECIDGTCECEDGYEGELCDVELRAKFIGIWVSEDWECNLMPEGTERFEILRGETGLDVLLADPVDPTFFILGTLEGDKLVFPFQIVEVDGESVPYEGEIICSQEDEVIISLNGAFDGEVIICNGIGKRE